jgi:di/tricarboxylate transporter
VSVGTMARTGFIINIIGAILITIFVYLGSMFK